MVDITLLELHVNDADLGKYGSKLSSVAEDVADDEDLSETIDVETDSDGSSSGGKGKALLLSLVLIGLLAAAAKFLGGDDDFEELEELEELDDLAERP